MIRLFYTRQRKASTANLIRNTSQERENLRTDKVSKQGNLTAT